MRSFDFSSWHGVVLTFIGLALFALIGVGIRLLTMFTIQQRRERVNRQINERLRTLIGAYKVLGGSFTGDLAVDPAHLRDIRRGEPVVDSEAGDESAKGAGGSDRRRRIRDAVEAAISDIILLGTEEHVRLAERAARDLVVGRPVHTHELVISLRNFIREALDLDPVPDDLAVPMQGPTRPSSSGSRGKSDHHNAPKGGGRGGGGMESGTGVGLGGGFASGDPSDHHKGL